MMVIQTMKTSGKTYLFINQPNGLFPSQESKYMSNDATNLPGMSFRPLLKKEKCEKLHDEQVKKSSGKP